MCNKLACIIHVHRARRGEKTNSSVRQTVGGLRDLYPPYSTGFVPPYRAFRVFNPRVFSPGGCVGSLTLGSLTLGSFHLV